MGLLDILKSVGTSIFGNGILDGLKAGQQGAIDPMQYGPQLPQSQLGQMATQQPNKSPSLSNALLRFSAGLGGAQALQDYDLGVGGGKQNKPSDIIEWEYYNNLPGEQQQEYLRLKRAQQWLNTGGSFTNASTREQIDKSLPPQELPATKAAQQEAVKNVDLVKNPQIAGREAEERLKQDLAYSPKIEGEKTGSKERAQVDVEREKNFSKAQSALNSLERQANIVNENIDKALKLTDSPFASGYGSLLSALPESDARKLKNYLETIKVNIGFDQLQQMRDNSPTGGALGQVTDYENRLTQAIKGALDQGQSEQLKENLAVVKDLYPKVLEERRKAFERDFGKYKNSASSDAAPASLLTPEQALEELKRRGKIK